MRWHLASYSHLTNDLVAVRLCGWVNWEARLKFTSLVLNRPPLLLFREMYKNYERCFVDSNVGLCIMKKRSGTSLCLCQTFFKFTRITGFSPTQEAHHFLKPRDISETNMQNQEMLQKVVFLIESLSPIK